jgi:hypothetical protein
MNIQLDRQHKNFLIIDIETASANKQYSDMDERLQALWNKKASFLHNEDEQTPSGALL